MRKIIIAGNWKMNKTIVEAIELANGFKRRFLDLGNPTVEAVICPPFTALAEVAEVIADTNIGLGAQDLHWQDKGAFTGEVSAPMLKDAGCQFVIIGHSERRLYFGETNDTVNKKIKVALTHGLIPIVCVGETLSEREDGKTFQVLDDHVLNSLKDIPSQEALRLVIAYEPVWAIGTGRTATSQQAEEAQKYIRGLLTRMYTKETTEEIRIQYGGSVKPDNIRELIQQPDVDGALVGGASLEVETFFEIVRISAEVRK